MKTTSFEIEFFVLQRLPYSFDVRLRPGSHLGNLLVLFDGGIESHEIVFLHSVYQALDENVLSTSLKGRMLVLVTFHRRSSNNHVTGAQMQ